MIVHYANTVSSDNASNEKKTTKDETVKSYVLSKLKNYCCKIKLIISIGVRLNIVYVCILNILYDNIY